MQQTDNMLGDHICDPESKDLQDWHKEVSTIEKLKEAVAEQPSHYAFAEMTDEFIENCSHAGRFFKEYPVYERPLILYRIHETHGWIQTGN